MKKLVLIVLLITFASGFASAQTVFIYIKKTDGTSFAGKSLPAAYAFEGGVTDEFFDAGHIVINAGIKNISYVQGHSMIMAKRNGANYLLEISLQYVADEDTGTDVIVSARYTFYNVNGGKTLSEGVLGVDNTAEAGKTLEDVDFQLGKALAVKSLASLQGK